MKKLYLISVFVVLSWFLYNQASAEVPQMINYQGKLTKTTGAPLDTTIQMVFTIYADSNGSTPLWTETRSAVVVEKGVFNVLLGSVNSIPYSVFDGSIRYLGVKVGDDPEITPRKPMVSVAYAYHVGSIDGAMGDTIYVNSIHIDPTTRYYSIPSFSFDLLQSAAYGMAEFSEHQEWRSCFSGSSGPKIGVSAPIHLPQGAIITKVVLYYNSDYNPPGNPGTFRVSRATYYYLPQQVDTLGIVPLERHVVSWDSATVSSFSSAMIDNSKFFYFLTIEVAPVYLCFYGARIEYVIEKPLP
ncbi:MAG: hypothetical protein WCE90_01585 [Candidatus Zixiibacteriota bacterium]